MNIAHITAKAAVAAGLSASALGIGAGMAHADDWPWPLPGPGVNVGHPGNPLPPGQDGLPPPGHRNWQQIDGYDYGAPPNWAPLRPLPPPWAPLAPVVWNGDIQVWGVWLGGAFIAL